MPSEKVKKLIDESVEKSKTDLEFAAALKANPQKAVKDTFNATLTEKQADEFIEGVMRKLLEEMIVERREGGDSLDSDKIAAAVKTAFDAAVDGAHEMYRQMQPIARDAYKKASAPVKTAYENTSSVLKEQSSKLVDDAEDTYKKTKPIAEEAVSNVVEGAEDIYRKSKPIVEGAMNQAVDDAETAYQKARPMVEEVTEKASARAEEVYRKTKPLMEDAANRVRKDLDDILNSKDSDSKEKKD